MKALAIGANDLPWLSPAAQTLRVLARSPLSTVWPQLQTDPGLVLLVARAWGRRHSSKKSCDVRVLRTSLQCLQASPDAGWVDWNRSGYRNVYDSTLTQSRLAAGLAELVPGCEPQRAWVAGLTASVGWLAACAADPDFVAKTLMGRPAFDSAALARRIVHAWRLPPWLSAIGGHLALPFEIAGPLGADPVMFRIVQLAVLLHQRDGGGLRLAVGTDIGELLAALRLGVEQVETVADRVARTPQVEMASEPPASQPLLVDLLELALRDRRRDCHVGIERLHREIDRFQQSVASRRDEGARRLHALKISALAEFAAGAGHEINNPLAVISGQAQYLLRQLDRLDGPAEEIDNPVEYLAHLRSEVVPSLQKIIGQTHRIHGILTDLMQFARPAAAKVQPVELGGVIGEVSRALQSLADERRVRLTCEKPTEGTAILADPAQLGVALAALVRNAIEAAPAGGWAGLRVEHSSGGRLALVVEDSGAGPGPVAQEHLFDPFYSGRSAGRGRGLGLPTAWRLACQQGGDLRFDGTSDGVTRFSLILPAAVSPQIPVFVNGRNGSALRDE